MLEVICDQEVISDEAVRGDRGRAHASGTRGGSSQAWLLEIRAYWAALIQAQESSGETTRSAAQQPG